MLPVIASASAARCTASSPAVRPRQLRVGQVYIRVVAHRLHPAGDPHSRGAHQRIQRRDGEGRITRVQQQVVQPGIAARDVVGQPGVALQPGGLGHLAPEPPRRIDPGRRRFLRWGQQPQRVLQHVDPGAAMWRIDHQPHPTVRRQHRGQRPQPRQRVGQVVQHAAAVDVVEGAEAGAGELQQRTLPRTGCCRVCAPPPVPRRPAAPRRCGPAR